MIMTRSGKGGWAGSHNHKNDSKHHRLDAILMKPLLFWPFLSFLSCRRIVIPTEGNRKRQPAWRWLKLFRHDLNTTGSRV